MGNREARPDAIKFIGALPGPRQTLILETRMKTESL